jgi:hypothetical protein
MFFVNTKFVCLPLLYHPCFSASRVRLTLFSLEILGHAMGGQGT